jgi:hypothetical protein
MIKSAERFAAILNRARALVSNERFQNWQVSFPGVWKQWESAELNGGFHAVIGNPPYVRQELIKEYKPALKRAFSVTYDGSADLYVYFTSKASSCFFQAAGCLMSLRTNGCALVMPRGCVSSLLTGLGLSSSRILVTQRSFSPMQMCSHLC